MDKDSIKQLAKVYESLMPTTIVLAKNKPRFTEAMEAIQKIADLVWDSDEKATINVAPDELTGTSICVNIKTDLFVVDRVMKLCDALCKADTFEVTPLIDGFVGIGITFEKAFVPAPPITK